MFGFRNLTHLSQGERNYQNLRIEGHNYDCIYFFSVYENGSPVFLSSLVENYTCVIHSSGGLLEILQLDFFF